jgi:type III pantothenate kinase
MLLAIDIGNTNATCGLFRRNRLCKVWKLPCKALEDARSLARTLASGVGKGRAAPLAGICIASVVPRLDARFRAACREAFGRVPLFATHRTIGIAIRGYDRKQVGADRLVAALAAYERTGRATIVVDAGTAITIDLVNGRGEFAGGVIVPGLATHAAALHAVAEKLPLVKIRPLPRVRGRSTEEAIRGGIFHGTAGLVDHLVREISREARVRARVIATGGDAKLLARACTSIHEVRPDLILEGLQLVWERRKSRDS